MGYERSFRRFSVWLRAYFVPSTVAPPKQSEFEISLFTGLTRCRAINAIVGTNIFPFNVPEVVTAPSLTYQILGLPREMQLDGPSGIARAMVRLIARSRSETGADDVKTIRTALRLMLTPQPEIVPRPFFGTAIHGAIFLNEADAYEEPADSSDLGTHMCVCDFAFRYAESNGA
jgi:hypothetical protein